MYAPSGFSKRHYLVLDDAARFEPLKGLTVTFTYRPPKGMTWSERMRTREEICKALYRFVNSRKPL